MCLPPVTWSRISTDFSVYPYPDWCTVLASGELRADSSKRQAGPHCTLSRHSPPGRHQMTVRLTLQATTLPIRSSSDRVMPAIVPPSYDIAAGGPSSCRWGRGLMDQRKSEESQ